MTAEASSNTDRAGNWLRGVAAPRLRLRVNATPRFDARPGAAATRCEARAREALASDQPRSDPAIELGWRDRARGLFARAAPSALQAWERRTLGRRRRHTGWGTPDASALLRP